MTPWHPGRDGLLPIAQALEQFVKFEVGQLPTAVQYESTSPSHLPGLALSGPGRGPVGRVEITRRWLQANGYAADAAELASRVAEILARLRAWEATARRQVAWRAADLADPTSAEPIALLGEDARDEYEAVCDAATYTADYVRQLAAMVSAKLAAKLVEPEPAAKPAEPPKPRWNRATGELTFQGRVAKRIQNLAQAVNVVRILDAFEEEGWPERIDDPLPGGRDAMRLKQAIQSLNRSSAGLRFLRDGTGEGIRWHTS